ncbi:Inactive serine/threonine-protein kinase [Arabidopsis thaliana]
MGWWRKKKKPKSEIASERGAKLLKDLIECCDGKSNPIKFFSTDEIRKATNNFSDSNLVSELSHDSDDEWYSGARTRTMT